MFPKQTERKYHFIVVYDPLTLQLPELFRVCGFKHEFYGFLTETNFAAEYVSNSKLTRSVLAWLQKLLAQWRGYFNNRHVSLAIVFDVKTDYRQNLKFNTSAAECSPQLLSDRRWSESQQDGMKAVEKDVEDIFAGKYCSVLQSR